MKYTRAYVEAKGNMFRHEPVTKGEWILTSAMGIPLYVREDDQSVTPCLVRDGYWESWITAWFMNEIDRDTLFIDVGANTGYYSLIAKHRGTRAVAYEPNPKYAEMLRETAEFSWSESHGDWLPGGGVVVREKALADKAGTVTLNIPEYLQGSASITDADLSNYNPHGVNVECSTLDAEFDFVPLSKMLIKVDAEGAEEMIWDGAAFVRQMWSPVWMIEYTPGAYSDDFLNKLEAYGDLAWISHNGTEEPISASAIEVNNDWVMLVVRPRG